MTDLLSGFGATTQPQFWVAVLEIIWINVLLSGDNAIVIALACRRLPSRQRAAGIMLGTAAALLLRLVFASVVVTLMLIPWVKMAGGVALFWIAAKLLMPNESSEEADAPAHGLMLIPWVKMAGGVALFWIAAKLLMPNESSEAADAPAHGLLRAIAVIAAADVVMSLDNVIAVAAAADGNIALLVFGLAISVPAIVGGATLIAAMINRFPPIVWAGAALLGWIAGDVLASDPVIVDAARGLGPGAHDKIKLSCAIVGMAGTLVAGYLGRARLARQT